MRNILLISSVLMLMAPAVQAAPPSAKISKQLANSCRSVVEDAGFVTPEGKKVALSEVVAGRPTALLIIKGYWCLVCQKQLASSSRQLAKLEARGAAIIGLSTEDAGTNRLLMEQLRLDFPIYGEPSAQLLERVGFWSKKNGHPTPGILFLDRCGDVAYRYFGRWPGRGQDKLIEKTLDQLLKAPANCGDV